MKKKHAPIDQLREAAKIARQMLIDKGLHTKESFIDHIEGDSTKPTLPGLPSYLPHKWTILWSQNMMYNILKDWQTKCGDDLSTMEDFAKFIEFAVIRLNKAVSGFKKKKQNVPKLIRETDKSPLLSEVFSPLQQFQTAKAMRKFFVDSFAVAIIVKSHDSTGNYADWFLNEWTPSLYSLWEKNETPAER